jgi:hypothetical protein
VFKYLLAFIDACGVWLFACLDAQHGPELDDVWVFELGRFLEYGLIGDLCLETLAQ